MRVTITAGVWAIAALVAQVAVAIEPPEAGAFREYWYSGVAELTSYDLEQARYGEVHSGHAVLIFVTEDFSRGKQVKLDTTPRNPADRVPILKLNLTKSFNTGIYPYSMMTSAFTPVDLSRDPRTLKVTTSSQEWCGHTFTQLNAVDDGYRLDEKSYFEGEGDRTLDLDGELLEDGLWNLIRIDPSALPVGSLRVVPGSMYQRLSHQPWAVRRAVASLEPVRADDSMRYRLEYPDLGRVLTIEFQSTFPFTIEGWEETYRSGFGPGARELTTRATLRERTQLDYWNRHDVADEPLRRELGLP